MYNIYNMKAIHIDFTHDILLQLELMVKKMTLDYQDGFITNIKLHKFIDDVNHITENNELFKSHNSAQSGGKLQNVKAKPKTMKEKPLIHKEPNARKPKTMKERPLLHKEPKARKPKTMKEKPLIHKEPKARKPKTMKERPLIHKEPKARKPKTLVNKELLVNHIQDELHYIPSLVMSKEKSPHIGNNIDKVVTLSYDNDPYTYNKAIVEYVNSPNSDLVLCMGSFKLTEQGKPKKMSKATFRRIIILFFASILATSAYAKPDIRNTLYRYIGNLYYLRRVLYNAWYYASSLIPYNFNNFMRLFFKLVYLSDRYHFGTILTYFTTARFIITPIFGNNVGLFTVVNGTYTLSNNIRKLSIRAFDIFIDNAYDLLIENYDKI